MRSTSRSHRRRLRGPRQPPSSRRLPNQPKSPRPLPLRPRLDQPRSPGSPKPPPLQMRRSIRRKQSLGPAHLNLHPSRKVSNPSILIHFFYCQQMVCMISLLPEPHRLPLATRLGTILCPVGPAPLGSGGTPSSSRSTRKPAEIACWASRRARTSGTP